VVKRKVMILGAGGHARVVANIAALTADLDIVGIADKSAATVGERIGGTKIVASLDDLPRWRGQGITHVALAFGGNQERARAMHEAEANGLASVTLVHPAAVIEDRVAIGDGALICAGAVLVTECRIGRGAIVNTGASVDHESEVGECAHIAPGCRVAGRVTVGDRALLGIAACVVPGRRIGADAVVGAGAVVINDVPAGVTVVGVPARIVTR
jgi:sugar O-acyltransferase (sialic acid O-acetyltransferase NeuD family)